MNIIKILFGRWRNMWGFCPKCNSDAPEVYTCDVCDGNRDFYPSKQIRKERIQRYINQILNI